MSEEFQGLKVPDKTTGGVVEVKRLGTFKSGFDAIPNPSAQESAARAALAQPTPEIPKFLYVDPPEKLPPTASEQIAAQQKALQEQEAVLQQQASGVTAPTLRDKFEALQEQEATAAALKAQLEATQAKMAALEEAGKQYREEQTALVNSTVANLIPLAKDAESSLAHAKSELEAALKEVDRVAQVARVAAVRVMVAIEKHQLSYFRFEDAWESVSIAREFMPLFHDTLQSELKSAKVSTTAAKTFLPRALDGKEFKENLGVHGGVNLQVLRLAKLYPQTEGLYREKAIKVLASKSVDRTVNFWFGKEF